MNLRPSSLPKLAACPRYESSPISGPYADRGQLLDSWFRAQVADPFARLSEADEDAAAVNWAVDTARLLAGGAELEARESHLGVEVMGMTGTADLLCSEKLWSADLKTGKISDYWLQQAAYALGFMDSHFADSWTVHLLYCDEHQLVTTQYTREQCEVSLRSLLAVVKDPLAAPTPCEYCDWCAKRWRCPQKLETVAWYLGLPNDVDLESIASEPDQLAQLLDLTHSISRDGGVHALLRGQAASVINTGGSVPGWRLQAGREFKTVDPVQVALQCGHTDEELLQLTRALLASAGNMSADKARAALASLGARLPDELIQTNHGAAYLAKSTKKPKTK